RIGRATSCGTCSSRGPSISGPTSPMTNSASASPASAGLPPAPTRSARQSVLPRPTNVHRANVVGLGLIGGSIGKALRVRGWRVQGTDVDPARVATAQRSGAIDEAGLDPDAELSFVAVPALAVPDAVKETLAATGGLVTDTAGVKTSVVAAVDDDRFLGGHP